LYLLGRHKAAIEVFDEVLSINANDWEVLFYKGLSYKFLRIYDEAIANFERSNELHQHENTFIELGRIYQIKQDYQKAIDIYVKGLEASPENTEILTTIGLLFIRLGDNSNAFDFLNRSLDHDPRNPKSILAAGSII
jgi:Bardet-Biedl syndrome 4 protein